MLGHTKLILASASPRRLMLLNQMGVEPDSLQPADIDETPLKRERPRSLALRLAEAKAMTVHRSEVEKTGRAAAYVLAADTVVAVGRRVLGKAETLDDAIHFIRMLSGRNHRVFGGVALISPQGHVRRKTVETRVRFKSLSSLEIDAYISSGEWRDKAGGYAIQGVAGAFVVNLIGSYSNVVGLPLYETMSLLNGAGYPLTSSWANAEITSGNV